MQNLRIGTREDDTVEIVPEFHGPGISVHPHEVHCAEVEEQAACEFFGIVGVERPDVRVVALEPEIALSRRLFLNGILVASRHGYAFDAVDRSKDVCSRSRGDRRHRTS